MKKFIFAFLIGCTAPPLEDRITSICKEGKTEGSDAPDPCQMSKGQLRQWFVDNNAVNKKQWIELVKKAETVRQLVTLWSCRHDDGSSQADWGWALSPEHPGCVYEFDRDKLRRDHPGIDDQRLLVEFGIVDVPLDAEKGLCPSCDRWESEDGCKELRFQEHGFVREGRDLDCPEW